MASSGTADKNSPETKNNQKSEIEKDPPETNKKRINKIRRQLEKLKEDPEEKKRVNKIRKQLQKLKREDPKEKRINWIRTELDKLQADNANRIKWVLDGVNNLEEEDSDDEHIRQIITSCGGKRRLIYDIDSTAVKYPNRENTKRDLRKSAELALGYFNKTNPVKYYVVDVIRATRYPCEGYVLGLTFTARPEDNRDERKTFETRIYFGIGQTEVDSVQILAA